MSKIEWTEKTWNPTTGCTRKSPGCDNCYAFTMTKRLAAMGQEKYQGVAGRGHFNGTLRRHDDELEKPLRWKKPRRVFVNSMSDLFHPNVPFEFIDRVFGVMAKAYWHTFQVLTKRPERMAEYLSVTDGKDNVLTRIINASQQFPACFPGGAWVYRYDKPDESFYITDKEPEPISGGMGCYSAVSEVDINCLELCALQNPPQTFTTPPVNKIQVKR